MKNEIKKIKMNNKSIMSPVASPLASPMKPLPKTINRKINNIMMKNL